MQSYFLSNKTGDCTITLQYAAKFRKKSAARARQVGADFAYRAKRRARNVGRCQHLREFLERCTIAALRPPATITCSTRWLRGM